MTHPYENIRPFVTDLDAPVYGFKNVPPQVAGAVISRFSRSEHGARHLLSTEFFGDLPAQPPTPELGGKAADFYDRVLNAYGDDSIAELAGVHIVTERISLLAAKFLEDRRTLSPIEESTRYVTMQRDPEGKYPYVIPAELGEPGSMIYRAYCSAMDNVFDQYHEGLKKVEAYLFVKLEKPEDVSDGVWKRTIHAKALDTVRSLLPLSTKTNVGMFANARTYEYMIYNAKAVPLQELQKLGDSIHGVCKQLIPAMVRRVETSKGEWAIERLSKNPAFRTTPRYRTPTTQSAPSNEVALIGAYPVDIMRLLNDIVFEQTELGYDEIEAVLESMDTDGHMALIAEYVGERRSRYDKLGRAFETPVGTFEITSTLAAWRDLHRHRMTMQQRQAIGTKLGYEIPPTIIEMGLEDWWVDIVGNVGAFASILRSKFGWLVAAYATPLCYRIRWRMTCNFRELVHICELRTQPAGHDEYRRIARTMYELVNEQDPVLGKLMYFVHKGDVALNRLLSEQRLEAKNG